MAGQATHGHTRGRRGEAKQTAEYIAWSAMCRRCHTPSDARFAHYGARGIRVTEDWRGPGGFVRFLAHTGLRPSAKHSLDRIDNDGHYEPGNVRWATRVEQSRNRTDTRRIAFAGRTQVLADWAREFGLQPNVLHARVFHLGWDMARALSTPVAARRPA